MSAVRLCLFVALFLFSLEFTVGAQSAPPATDPQIQSPSTQNPTAQDTPSQDPPDQDQPTTEPSVPATAVPSPPAFNANPPAAKAKPPAPTEPPESDHATAAVATAVSAVAVPQPAGPQDPQQKAIFDSSANLLKLANMLKAEVDKTTADQLSVSVVRKAGEIEQLAHKMRTQ